MCYQGSYPAHQPGSYDLADEVDERTITFLAKETAYSTLSLKPMELTAASLELEGLLLPSEVPFQSQRYSYFRPQFSMQLLRVPKVPLAAVRLSTPPPSSPTRPRSLPSAP